VCGLQPPPSPTPYPCTFTVDGVYYDLSPLYVAQYGEQGIGDLALSDSNPSNNYYTHYVAFCSTVQYPPSPPAKKANFVQASSRGGGPWMVSSWAQQTPTATGLPGGGHGIVLTSHNGDICAASPRVAVITLVCNPNGPIFPSTLPQVTSANCQYTFTMETPAACGVSAEALLQ